ncbi:glycerol acyltransferase [Mycobacteriaceae bacterium 1482268.1]|nr:glycerol acyltransferase [Mycobacteriaceae bacterium 1482268.1]
MDTTMSAVASLGREFVRRYQRLEIDCEQIEFDQPTLLVANHGFGGIFDLNVLAISAALEQLDLRRPVTILTHQLAWTLGVGPLIEPLGARPASHESAREAFDNGHHVVVLPGGDVEASKTTQDRDQIIFAGRTGFARLAIEQNVPIVPLVTAGAGESLLVLSNGERLARALKLDELLRVKTLPVTVSLPWGLNVGVAGMLPYLPLPTKLHTRVLAPITHQSGESAQNFAERVQTYMQDALTEMTKNRRPLLG